MKNPRTYAVYKGDEFITHGTKQECAEKLGVSINTINYWGTVTYQKRLKDPSKGMLVIRVEEDDDEN